MTLLCGADTPVRADQLSKFDVSALAPPFSPRECHAERSLNFAHAKSTRSRSIPSCTGRIARFGAGIITRERFWVAQRFSAAINVVFLLGALAPGVRGSTEVFTENRELRTLCQ